MSPESPGLLDQVIDYLQAKLPPNRVVGILTPLIFAPLAGFVSVKAARLGINIDSSEALAAFVSGSLIAASLAYKWVDGWQKRERDLRDGKPFRRGEA